MHSPVVEQQQVATGAHQSALVPDTFVATARTEVRVDAVPATLLRYERADRRNQGLMGEHISMVMGAEGKLKGFTRMDLDVQGELPSRDRANTVAIQFLKRHAPDLIANMQVSWIDPHDELIRDASGARAVEKRITGMKVKCRNGADGTWFWVIVGPKEQVITFERDIVWVTFPGRRKTEKWLHDAWLAEQKPASAPKA